MKNEEYHTSFVIEPDVVRGMSAEAVDKMRLAWGAHHDDYAPPEKKFLTPEFQGGNKATIQKIRALNKLCLQQAQREMNQLV